MEKIVNKSTAERSNNSIKPLVFAGVALLASVLTATASASGSFGPAGNGPKVKYNQGKVIFHKKVSCSSCPSPSKSLDKKSASDLINSLNSNSAENIYLKSSEKKAVIYYLKKRYKVK